MLRAAYWQFVAAFREAAYRLRRGDRLVRFPERCFSTALALPGPYELNSRRRLSRQLRLGSYSPGSSCAPGRLRRPFAAGGKDPRPASL